MIEESGCVVKVEDGYAWIETEPATACSDCAARQGCGTSVLAALFGQRKSSLPVPNAINAAVGDQVVIGIPETALLRGSLAVYIAPLAGLFAGGLLGRLAAQLLFPGGVEPVSILGGMSGLVAGFVWLRGFSRRSKQDARYLPVLLRSLISSGH